MDWLRIIRLMVMQMMKAGMVIMVRLQRLLTLVIETTGPLVQFRLTVTPVGVYCLKSIPLLD
jgi:hypothetical protein